MKHLLRSFLGSFGFLAFVVTACGSGAAAIECGASVEAYCAGHGGCPASPSAWTTTPPDDDGGTSFGAQASGQSPALASSTGTCQGFTYFNALEVDQSSDYYYDATGKLVAIAGWVSSGSCTGSCRYACLAGPSRFDPCAVAPDARKH
jgi:hypothetical protein